MNRRLGLVGLAAGILIAATLTSGLADGAASGKVIGMTSGGWNKGYGVVDFAPGLTGHRAHKPTMTITSPINNVQASGTIGGTGAYGTNTGGQLTATLTDSSSDSCLTFTTGATTWTGTGAITFPGTTGTAAHVMKLTHYTLTFWRGVSYANEKASVAGDGVKDGTETGSDSFLMPTGFSCSTPGAVLTSMSVLGVLKITTP